MTFNNDLIILTELMIKSGKDGAKMHRLYAKCLILIDILIKMIRYSYF